MGILEHRDPQQGNANKKQVSYITHIVYSSLFILFAIVYIKYTMTTRTELSGHQVLSAISIWNGKDETIKVSEVREIINSTRILFKTTTLLISIIFYDQRVTTERIPV
jgi:hypothetical protein